MNKSTLLRGGWHTTRVRRLLFGSAGIVAAATVVQSCCEIGSASDAESLASSDLTSCSDNHAKGQMSVVLASKVANWDNDLLKNTLNGAMKTFINPKVLSLKSVDSVDGGTDTVRFLQLDGKFGNGLGVGSRVLSKLFKEGERGSGLLGSGTLTNIQEALEVKSPDPLVSKKFPASAPFNALEEFMEIGHPDGDLSEFAISQFNPDEQWAPAQTGYTAAIARLKTTIGTSNKIVRVAVLDTGIDVDHPDLKDVIDRNLAYNALTGKVGAAEVDDKQGHGTHVAGIIAGQGRGKGQGMGANVRGVAGEFPNNIRIVPIKVLGDDGTGSTAAMNRGIRWATKNNIDVISMSLGSGSNYECLKDQGLRDPVIQEAIDKGIIVVAAAGNESCPLGGACPPMKANPQFTNYTVLPCAAENVLCVGSNDFNEAPSEFSNYASNPTETVGYRVAPDIIAPGSKILSTYPRFGRFAEYRGVAVLDGTSMATPYVSGIAALLKLAETTQYPVNQATFKTYLQEAAYKGSNYQQQFRAGRVDLQAMVQNRDNRINNNPTRETGAEKKVPFNY